jgi:hypothetical protein
MCCSILPALLCSFTVSVLGIYYGESKVCLPSPPLQSLTRVGALPAGGTPGSLLPLNVRWAFTVCGVLCIFQMVAGVIAIKEMDSKNSCSTCCAVFLFVSLPCLCLPCSDSPVCSNLYSSQAITTPVLVAGIYLLTKISGWVAWYVSRKACVLSKLERSSPDLSSGSSAPECASLVGTGRYGGKYSAPEPPNKIAVGALFVRRLSTPA